MAISEQKLKELAAIEPPKFLERIADFLADLTMRSSSVAVLERAEPAEPVGSVGLAAQSLGQRLTQRANVIGGTRSIEWLYSLMRPYQIGPYELRQFSMWLVRWHDKLAETEVIRRPGDGASAVEPSGERSGRALEPPTEPGAEAARRRLRVMAGAAVTATEIIEVVEPPKGAVRRVRVLRRGGLGPTPEPVLAETEALEEASSERPPSREPDVLSRAWRAGHQTRASAAGEHAEPTVELAPPGARKALTRTLWMSNLAMAGAAAGFIMGRTSQTGALVSRVAAPAMLGVAGPATTGVMYAPGLAFPLSHPPVSTASWLGAAAPTPELGGFVPMPGAPIPSPMAIVTPGQPAGPSPLVMPVVPTVVQQPALRPGVEAVATHRGALREAFAATSAEQDTGGTFLPGTVAPRHPSSAPSRSVSPIPGLLAAGLAGYLIGRLAGRGGTVARGGEDLFVQPLPALPGQPQRARIFSPSRPDSIVATLVPPAGPGQTGTWVQPPGFVPPSHVVLGVRGGPMLHGPLAAPEAPSPFAAGRLARDPRLGEVTIVAPPVLVASEQAERRGAAVAFDWPALARGAGELDAAGLKRLQSVLPPGAQAIYPALPRTELPPGAVNLRVAPSLLKPLLTDAYGSQAAGIAGSAAATASAVAGTMPSNIPVPGRIVPARRPAGETAGVIGPEAPGGPGALQEAGAGQARRSAMLDFLGVPVRLAPSLGGRPELRDELAIRGVGDQQVTTQAIRPQVFGPLRQRLFPGLQTVQAEPDKTAWRRAAPHFGMRDAEPTTVLAPDARVRRLGADAPLPQVATDRPSGVVHPLAVPAALSPGAAQMGAAIVSRWQSSLPGPAGAVPPQGAFPVPGALPRTLRPGGAEPASRMEGGPALRQMEPLSASHPSRLLSDLGAGTDGALGGSGEPFDIARPRLRPRTAASQPTPTPLARQMMRRREDGHDSGAWLGRMPDLPGVGMGALERTSVAGGGHMPMGFGAEVGTTFAEPEPPSLVRMVPPVHGPVQGFGVARAGFGTADVVPRRLDRPSPLGLPVAAASALMAGSPSVGSGFGQRAAQSVPPPTVAGRMGLPALRSAVGMQGVGTSPATVQPMAVRVPELLPIAAPVLARVDAPRDRSTGPVTAEPRPGPFPESGPGRLELPAVATPPLLAAVPVGIGLPLPLPVPQPGGQAFAASAPDVPAMPLPVGMTQSAPVPAKTTTTIASRAPGRVYAAVDAGPASRNLALQRASMSGGVAGGPNMPMPSPQRAQRITADTQRASVLSSREDGMTANEVHLLANDVWSILRRRLALEADRRGKW